MRTQSQRFRVLPIGLWVLAIVGRSRLAHSDEPIRIEYDAPPDCPSREGFFSGVKARTPLAREASPGEQARVFRVQFVRKKKSVRGVVTGRDEHGRPAVRSVDGDTCAEVASALTLVTALAIDPEALSRPGKEAGKVNQDPELAPQPKPPAPIKAAVPLAPRLPVLPKGKTFLAGLEWTLGSHVSASFAIWPTSAFGPAVFLERAFLPRAPSLVAPSFRLSLRGTFAPAPSTQFGADVTWAATRLGGCPWSWSPAHAIRVSPACIGLDLGFFHAKGVNVDQSRSGTRLWSAVNVLAALRWYLTKRLSLEAAGGVVFPLKRDSFVFAGPETRLHEIPLVGGELAFGVGVQLF